MAIIVLTHFTHHCFTGFFPHFASPCPLSRASFLLFLDNAVLPGSTFPAKSFSSQKALPLRSPLQRCFSKLLRRLHCAPCLLCGLYFPFITESPGLRRQLRTKVLCAALWSLAHKLGIQCALSNNSQISGLADAVCSEVTIILPYGAQSIPGNLFSSCLS